MMMMMMWSHSHSFCDIIKQRENGKVHWRISLYVSVCVLIRSYVILKSEWMILDDDNNDDDSL